MTGPLSTRNGQTDSDGEAKGGRNQPKVDSGSIEVGSQSAGESEHSPNVASIQQFPEIPLPGSVGSRNVVRAAPKARSPYPKMLVAVKPKVQYLAVPGRIAPPYRGPPRAPPSDAEIPGNGLYSGGFRASAGIFPLTRTRRDRTSMAAGLWVETARIAGRLSAASWPPAGGGCRRGEGHAGTTAQGGSSNRPRARGVCPRSRTAGFSHPKEVDNPPGRP